MNEYTIDAIKYIDGTEIKDVRMDGEKTIKAGVKYELLPGCDVLSNTVTTTSFNLIVDVKDNNNLLKKSSGIYFFLFDGKNIVTQKSLQLGINNIEVNDLLMGKEYTYMIVGVYDDYSGKGKRANELISDNFKTLNGYLLDVVEKDQDSIKLNLEKINDDTSFESVCLYLNDELISEIKNDKDIIFNGLQSGTTYQVVLKYSYKDNNQVEIKSENILEVQTLEKVEPIITINSLLSGKKEISYEFGELDIDNTKQNVNVTLYQDIYNVSSLSSLSGTFTNLYANTDYKLVITYEYDLSDGSGIKTIVNEYNVKTKAINVPLVDITYTFDINSISYKSTINDIDQSLIDISYKLYHNDVLIDSSNDHEYIFNNLKSNTEYQLVLDYNYDLKDNLGQINNKNKYIIVLGKEVPQFSLTSYFISDNSIEYNLLISDPNASGRLNMIALYKENNFVKRLDETTSKIEGLESNSDYIIKANYVYDFNDGQGSKEINYEYKFKTLKIDPSINIKTNNVTNNSIEFVYDIVDKDKALELLKIELLLNDNVIKEFNNFNQTTFDNLLSDNLYTIRATFNKDLNTGSEEIVKSLEVKTDAMQKPTVDFNLESTKSTINYSYTVNDPDNISTLKDVEIYYKGVKLDKNSIENSFNDLYSNSEYEIVVKLLCDYKNGLGLKEEVYSEFIITDSYHEPSVEIDLTSTVDTIKYQIIENDIYELLKVNKINVYKGMTLVKEITNFENGIINDLLSNTLYRVELVYEYDLNDNNGKHLKSFERSYSTLAHDVVVIGYEVLNNGSPKTNEDISLNIKLENESKVPLENIVINGEKLQIVGGDKYNNIIVLLKAPKVSGIFNVNVERMTYFLNGIEVEQKVDTIEKINIEIMSRLDIVSVSSLDFNNVISYDSEMGLLFTIDNPNNYVIESYTIGSSEYDVIMIDNNHVYIPDYKLRDHLNTYNINVNKVVYRDSNENTTSRNYNDRRQLLITQLRDISKTNIISTPEDLLNIESHKSYELANDIDMSGYTWEPIDFNGYFDGKGYSIKNLSVVVENEYTNTTLTGIFEKLNGTFKNVYFDNLYLYVKAERIINKLLYGTGNPTLENVLFTGNELCTFEMPTGENIYIVDDLYVNKAKHSYDNTVSKDQFETESFKNNILGWNFSDKEFGNYNGILYTLIDNSYIFITGYTGDNENLIIPEKINDLPVVGISDLAFSDSININSLEIGENIIYIGEEFINNCSNLEKLVIKALPSTTNLDKQIFRNSKLDNIKYLSITSKDDSTRLALNAELFNVNSLEYLYLDGIIATIQDSSLKEIVVKNTSYSGSFSYSKNLEKVTLENVENVETFGFKDCENLSSVTLINVKKIEKSAFALCKNLTTLNLPNTLTEIGVHAFQSCVKLNKLLIPNSVTSINPYAFGDGYQILLYTELESKPSKWSEEMLEEDDSIIYNFKEFYNYDSIEYALLNDNTTVIIKYNGSDDIVTINDTVLYNGDVYTVTEIGEFAFYNNELSEVLIPDTIIKINEYAFYECRNLSSIYLSNNLKEIGSYAFYLCNNLNTIIIPKSVDIIGSSAIGFEYEITIYCESSSKGELWDDNFNYNNNVLYDVKTTFKDDLFEYVLFNNYTAGILKYIGTDLDLNISSMIEYNNEIYELNYINNYAFSNTNIRSIILPDSITYVGSFAFYNCKNLETCVLSDNIKTIEMYTFYNCNSLYSINMPRKLEKVCFYAFFDCKIENIILPNSLKIIEGNAFSLSLYSIYIPKSVKEMGEYVISSAINVYCGAPSQPNNWSSQWVSLFEKITWGCDGIYNDGDYSYLLYSDKTATILRYYGNEENVNINEVISYENNEYIVTIISDGAFMNLNIKTITLPDTILSIGSNVFENCHSLTKITLSNNLQSIGDYALYNCGSLSSVYVPKTVTTVGYSAFGGGGYYTIIYTELLEKPIGWDDSFVQNGEIHWGQVSS